MHEDPRRAVEPVSRQVGRLLAPNAGPMTLDGTNSYLIASPVSAPVVVVDPGPDDDAHVRALADREVEVILLTHRHADHSEARESLAALTGAGVRAFDPEFCVAGAPLTDGEVISAAGADIRVVHTPGHTSDSVCFYLPDDGPTGSMLTGDTILGRGTTIIDFPDGTLGDYLDSLQHLSSFGAARVLPGHGPMRPDLATLCAEYRSHREERLQQIRTVLADIGSDASAEAVVDVVYADTDESLQFAALASVRAQLDYLRTTG